LVNISSVINDNLLNRFVGLAQNGAYGLIPPSTPSQPSSEATITDGLRVGANVFVTAVDSLNSGIFFLSLGASKLDKLAALSNDLYESASSYFDSSLSSQGKKKLGLQFQDQLREFLKIATDDSGEKLAEGLRATDLDELTEVLANVGLNIEDSSITLNQTLGKLKVFSESGDLTGGESLEDAALNIFRDGKSRIMSAILELKDGLKMNAKAFTNALFEMDASRELMRATGLAFLKISEDEALTTASSVAKAIRAEISRAGSDVKAQIHNLEPLVVASLLIDNVDTL
jgi:hypothetical protein